MIASGTGAAAVSMPYGIQVQGNVYGKALNLVYGLGQVPPDLIWYNNWKTAGSPSNSRLLTVTGGSSKKKSGKKGGTTYYSASLDMVLGLAPIAGVLTAWYNNQKFLVAIASASGVISGGQFTFNPGGESHVDEIITIPSAPPYTYQAPGFISPVYIRPNRSTHALWPQTTAGYPPGENEYSLVISGPGAGLYAFNAANAGQSINVVYQKLSPSGGTPATLAGILAVTVNEPFSAAFNDFGGPGAVSQSGAWNRPLWNAAFPVPGRIDSGAYRARDPYTWWWDGSTPTVNVPSALDGMPVTVYYGIPSILKSDGTFYSASITPLALLNLEFEPACGSGAEYASQPGQQVINPFAAGVGSVQFDLGAANAEPNLLLESIGAFALWPNGDCDVADIVTDIVMSGPVLGLAEYGGGPV